MEGPLSAEEQSQVAKITARVVHQVSMHSGPLPDPRTLAEYEQVQPGFAERIVSMAEKQQEHRLILEERVISGNVRAQLLGVILGFLLGLSGIVGGTDIALHGYPVGGFSTVLAALASLVGALLYSRRQQRIERREAAGASQDD